MKHIKKRDVVLSIVVVLILGLVAWSKLGNAKAKAARLSCVCNVKKLGLAYRIWANDHDGAYPMQMSVAEGGVKELGEQGHVSDVFRILTNELSVTRGVICPSDKQRQPAPAWEELENRHISYFIGLDAVDRKPGMLLSGDRNLMLDGADLSGVVQLGTNANVSFSKTLHRGVGNIGLADGSVLQVTSEELRDRVKDSGDSVNRLVLPQ